MVAPIIVVNMMIMIIIINLTISKASKIDCRREGWSEIKGFGEAFAKSLDVISPERKAYLGCQGAKRRSNVVPKMPYQMGVAPLCNKGSSHKKYCHRKNVTTYHFFSLL